MFVVPSLPVAILFCVVTMLGWGSWANTQKLAGKERWPFELVYWDYAIGVFLFSLLFAATLGSFGSAGAPAMEKLRTADMTFVWPALISGRVSRRRRARTGHRDDGELHRATEGPRDVVRRGRAERLPSGGVIYSGIAGSLMALFYPKFNTGATQPGMLTPYIALVCFGARVLASNLVWNTVFMRAGKVTYGGYFRGSVRHAGRGPVGCAYLEGVRIGRGDGGATG
jgi:glucose uptake protein